MGCLKYQPMNSVPQVGEMTPWGQVIIHFSNHLVFMPGGLPESKGIVSCERTTKKLIKKRLSPLLISRGDMVRQQYLLAKYAKFSPKEDRHKIISTIVKWKVEEKS